MTSRKRNIANIVVAGVLLGGLGLGIGSCGGGPATVTDYCQQTVAVSAKKLHACAGGSLQSWEASIRLGAEAQCDVLGRAVAEGRSHYDAAAAQACLDSFHSSSCEALLSAEAALAEACARVVTGSGAVGASCLDDWECVPGAYCTASLPDCSGTCQLYAKAGEACTDRCEPGYDCQDGTCVRPAPFPWSGQGEDCSQSICKLGLACDGTTKKCVSVLHAGQACDPENDVLCEPFTGCGENGRCEAAGGAGANCDHVACLPGYACESKGDAPGTCVALAHFGEVCAADLDCISQRCVDGHCSADDFCIAP